MEEFLSPYLDDFHISIQECPDLNKYPFYLNAPGLCGRAEVIEFGNHKHLYDPSKNKAPSWNLSDLTAWCTTKTPFVIGGGMSRGIPNREVVMNLKSSLVNGINNESHHLFLNELGQVVLECQSAFHPPRYDLPLCDLYGSFYVCSGKQNDILYMHLNLRDSNMQILDLMQHALRSRYFNSYVGLTGLFSIKEGEIGVMPRTFPQTLLEEPEDVYGWYHKYNFHKTVLIHTTMFNFKEVNVQCRDEGWVHDEMFCTVNDSSSQILRPTKHMGGRFLRSISAVSLQGYFNVVSKLHRVGAELLS